MYVSGYLKYGENNEREFVSGGLCDYDFDKVVHIVNLLQYQVPKRVSHVLLIM